MQATQQKTLTGNRISNVTLFCLISVFFSKKENTLKCLPLLFQPHENGCCHSWWCHFGRSFYYHHNWRFFATSELFAPPAQCEYGLCSCVCWKHKSRMCQSFLNKSPSISLFAQMITKPTFSKSVFLSKA